MKKVKITKKIENKTNREKLYKNVENIKSNQKMDIF